MHLNSIEALRSHIEQVSGKAVTDEDLMWFVAYINASMYFDCGDVKELASLFVKGCDKMTIADVQDYIDTHYEECDDENPDEEMLDCADEIVQDHVSMVYG